MKLLKMCLNWKVLVALGAVGAGAYALAPELSASALPLLLVAVCPLTMMLMMKSAPEGKADKEEQDVGETAEDLSREEQISRLRDQRQNISARISELQTDGRRSSEDL